MRYVNSRLDLIKEQRPGSVGAEIGVWRGYFSSEILNNTSVGMLYMVDSWEFNPSYEDPLNSTNFMEDMLEAAHNTRGHIKRRYLKRGKSLDVAASWPGPALDWVFIDADHSYSACLSDLMAWEKNLADDGVIMGHDYTELGAAKEFNFGVVAAVKTFCDIRGWFIDALTKEEYPSFLLKKNATS